MLMTKLLLNITGNDKTYSPRLAVRLYTDQNDLEGCSLGNCKVENYLLMLSLKQNSCHRQKSRYIHTSRKADKMCISTIVIGCRHRDKQCVVRKQEEEKR